MESKKQEIKRIRGTMAIHPEHRLVFTPQGKGQPQYEQIKKTTNGALMRTTGEKTQSLVAHLKVPADATDPAADLRDQLENVLKALPQQGKSPIPKGRRLLSNDGVEVRQNAKGFLEIGVKIDLRENVDYMKKFYEIMTEISKCLHYNADSLKRQCIALASSSTKQ